MEAFRVAGRHWLRIPINASQVHVWTGSVDRLVVGTWCGNPLVGRH